MPVHVPMPIHPHNLVRSVCHVPYRFPDHNLPHDNYYSLHESDFVKNQKWEVEELPQADKYTDCLVRFPLFYALEPDEVKYICEQIKSFYTSER